MPFNTQEKFMTDVFVHRPALSFCYSAEALRLKFLLPRFYSGDAAKVCLSITQQFSNADYYSFSSDKSS
ncbi:MAG: hypothetical protein D6816_08065 [Bacteroidetes bacterium]|nr:MAG: hypothetical protein D6816_08065 [Bacteroidota bacterium]